MLYLVLQLGRDRYALEATQVSEILPLVGMKQIPLAPVGLAGLFEFRGTAIPAIDLNQLALGRASESRLSTRIILVRYPDADGSTRLLGLIAEKVTETLRRDPSEFVEAGINNANAPYLGPVTHDGRGLIQRIDAGALLPPAVRNMLFRPVVMS